MYERVLWPIALFIFASTSLDVQAQPDYEFKTKTQAELNVVWAFAQGNFGDNLDRPIPGLIFSFGGHTPNLPLVLSTELGWLSYGFDNHLEIRFPNGNNNFSTSVVNVDAANSILMAHLVARFLPLEGKITPYIDGLVGIKYLSTNIEAESEVLFNDADNDIIIVRDNRFRTTATFDSFTVSYGFGAGFNIQIFNGELGMQNTPTIISLQVGARYLFGSEADYLTENSIQAAADGVGFEQVESDTDMLIPKLGFQLEF